MPSGYATVFELLMYILLLEAARHAWRVNRGPGLLRLTLGVVYGVLLEAATIRQLNAYHYGRFWVMITPEVPLAIGVGWGVIVYAVRTYTQALILPGWQRAVLNSLLALNIDVAMDVVAIRLGLWDWGQGFHFQYFGVPWANFWAWFWVVFGFTVVLEYSPSVGWRAWLAPFAALAAGLAGVMATNALVTFVLWPLGLANAAVAVVLGSALVLAISSRFWQRWRECPPALSTQVARVFHICFMVAGLISGALLHPPLLIAPTLLMLALAEEIYVRLPRGRCDEGRYTASPPHVAPPPTLP